MIHALQDRTVNREVPHAPLDADAVRAAYRRCAFGRSARRSAWYATAGYLLARRVPLGRRRLGPLGPWLVTADEVPKPQALAMWLDVSGERMQTGSTRTMIFDVEYLVSYVSQFMVLDPGDVIATGTPPGVGQGKKPPKFLKAGDVVTLGIEGLERFVRKEPLRRVHECVFGVLALESEPVDPRL